MRRNIKINIKIHHKKRSCSINYSNCVFQINWNYQEILIEFHSSVFMIHVNLKKNRTIPKKRNKWKKFRLRICFIKWEIIGNFIKCFRMSCEEDDSKWRKEPLTRPWFTTFEGSIEKFWELISNWYAILIT